jgi:RNA polymerase sigma factor (sigma-70 family)
VISREKGASKSGRTIKHAFLELPMSPPDSDFRELMEQVRNGSEEAAWHLVECYGERVRRAVRRSLNRRLRSKFDSLDFVQLVWSSFFRTRNGLDRFGRPEELAAFLVTMARNKVGMEVRRRLLTARYNVNRERSLDGKGSDALQDLTDREPPPLDTLIARERWERIMEHQPGHYRQIVELRLQGNTHREIADRLGVAECTVRRFLKKLSREAVA